METVRVMACRFEHSRRGPVKICTFTYDYPVAHKFTPIEEEWISELHTLDDSISIEWETPQRYDKEKCTFVKYAYVNRVFINNVEFRLRLVDDDYTVDMDNVLLVARRLLDKLKPYILLTKVTDRPKRFFRSKLRASILEIIKQTLVQFKGECRKEV